MIIIPLVLGDYVASGERKPFEVRKFLSGLGLQAESLINEVDTKLVYDGCIVAMQVSAKRNNILTINTDTLSNAEPVFSKWKAHRVDGTLGELNTPFTVRPTALPTTKLAASHTIMSAAW